MTDRYVISSYVYQSAQGVPLEWIREINKFAPSPDLNFYIRINVDTALDRLHQQDRDVVEKFETRDYLKTMIEKYDALIDEGLIVIDGDRDIDEITLDIVERIIHTYNNR